MEILSTNRVAISDLLKKEIDTAIVAMLNEALNEGYSFADVIAALDESGYKVIIKPVMEDGEEEEMEPEDDMGAPSEGTEAPEVEDAKSLFVRVTDAVREALGLDKADAEKAHGAHSFEESAEGTNCSVCAQKKDNWRHVVKAQGAEAVISKAIGEKRFTLAPMYVPDTLDAHGEWTDADELQNAVWEYVRSGDRRIRLQHQRDIVAGEWVEVMSLPYPMNVPMYKGDGTIEERTYPAGTVFLGVIWEEWAWDAVKSGALSGYSIGGRTDRVDAELPA